MKVLFITRKYPPSIGGMQKVSFDIINNFPELKNAQIIKWGKSQKGLILFIPWVLLKSFYLLTFKKINIIHFGDSSLCFIGYILKKIFKVPITITAHGLDLTYHNKLYQIMIKKTLKEFNSIICVSKASKDIAIKKGVKPNKCTIIPNGVDTSKWILKNKRKLKTKIDLKNKFILLSVGRLIKRKGIYWFIKNVFKKLDKNCVFLITSKGPEEEKIKDLIKSLKLEKRILILGKVSDETLKMLYNSADIFIMPNIHVEGDMEGFGIVAIEAASCGLPVVASNMEGIKDAIKNNKNGFLVEPYNVKEYVKKINEIKNMKDINKFKKEQINYTKKNYDIKKVSEKYYDLFKKILAK